MTLNITDELVDHLSSVLEDHLDKAADHIEWLNLNPDEPDREQQIEASERAMDLDKKLLALLA
jgi:hypothetical protein